LIINVLEIWKTFALIDHLYHMAEAGMNESNFSILYLRDDHRNKGSDRPLPETEEINENEPLNSKIGL